MQTLRLAGEYFWYTAGALLAAKLASLAAIKVPSFNLAAQGRASGINAVISQKNSKRKHLFKPADDELDIRRAQDVICQMHRLVHHVLQAIIE